MIAHIQAIAATEWRIGMRNRWVLLATCLLLLFSLVLAFLGAAPVGEVKAGRLSVTIASLTTLSVYLVPLISLLLTFDTIAGESERGTLPLLLATPVSRSSVIAGKFLGHVAVLALAITVGFGVAGGLVLALYGGTATDIAALVRLTATAIALGAAFCAIGTIISASTRQSGTAAALAIAVWLIAVVLYDLGLLGLLISAGEGTFARTIFPWLLLANPADAFRLYNLSALDLGSTATGIAGAADGLTFPPIVALGVIGLWIIASLTTAIAVFRRVEP